ncbi:MAG: hypothetical protein AB8I08_11685 [Sandaracinaceae bacterium]
MSITWNDAIVLALLVPLVAGSVTWLRRELKRARVRKGHFLSLPQLLLKDLDEEPKEGLLRLRARVDHAVEGPFDHPDAAAVCLLVGGPTAGDHPSPDEIQGFHWGMSRYLAEGWETKSGTPVIFEDLIQVVSIEREHRRLPQKLARGRTYYVPVHAWVVPRNSVFLVWGSHRRTKDGIVIGGVGDRKPDYSSMLFEEPGRAPRVFLLTDSREETARGMTRYRGRYDYDQLGLAMVAAADATYIKRRAD